MWFRAAMVVLPPAAFMAVFLWDGAPTGVAMPLLAAPRPVAASHSATVAFEPREERARVTFGPCAGPVRVDCVVDGDTFWYGGTKIRIADINTPEVSKPQCPLEAELGARATARLTELLNAGPFDLAPVERETDRYGRTLRIVTRDGESLGETLVSEGLAERWKGYRGAWC